MRDARAFLHADVDVAEHPLHVALLDERAELRGGVEGMAERDLRALHFGDQGDQFGADRVVREHARAGMAGFALIVVDAPGDAFGGGAQIGVGHHDMRALAAAFERDALHVALARIDHHQLADLGRAGEADHVDVHVQRERLAGLFAESRHDVEHAVGNARLPWRAWPR